MTITYISTLTVLCFQIVCKKNTRSYDLYVVKFQNIFLLAYQRSKSINNSQISKYFSHPNIHFLPLQISVVNLSTRELHITPPAVDQSTYTSSRVYTETNRQPFQPLQVVTTKRPASGEINLPDFKKPVVMYEQISPVTNDEDVNFINPELSEFLQTQYQDTWNI